jgi:hypothetical protein
MIRINIYLFDQIIDIQVGGMKVKKGPFWIPDALHIWLNYRGVHLFWSKSEYGKRIEFSKIPENDLIKIPEECFND